LCGYYACRETGGALALNELVILPEFQGRGIGSSLLQEIIEDANNRGMPVRLQVLKANRALKLYERLGFVKNGETETHFQMEHGLV
jgi:ribosomal protein S18 acetylase RimI-like enzyme